jgi:hypothetical protein
MASHLSPTFAEALEAIELKRGGTTCRTCSLPPATLSEVHIARKAGRSFGDIARALSAIGHKTCAGAIRNHFGSGHADAE